MNDPPPFEPEPAGGTHQWFVKLLLVLMALVVAAAILGRLNGSQMDHSNGSIMKAPLRPTALRAG